MKGELDFLVRIASGQIETGLSSRALALYGVCRGNLIDEYGFPAEPCDPSDLRRCFGVYDAAPLGAQIIMARVIQEWTETVFACYPKPGGTPEEVVAYMEQARRIGGHE